MTTSVRLALAFLLVLTVGCRAGALRYDDGSPVAFDTLYRVTQNDKRTIQVSNVARERLHRGLLREGYAQEAIRLVGEHEPDTRKFLLVVTFVNYDAGQPREVVLRADLFRRGDETALWSQVFHASSRRWDTAAYAAVDRLVDGLEEGFLEIEGNALSRR